MNAAPSTLKHVQLQDKVVLSGWQPSTTLYINFFCGRSVHCPQNCSPDGSFNSTYKTLDHNHLKTEGLHAVAKTHTFPLSSLTCLDMCHCPSISTGPKSRTSLHQLLKAVRDGQQVLPIIVSMSEKDRL